MPDFRSNLWDSAFDFERVVWPAVQEWCGGGTLIPVEVAQESHLATALDVLAGVDSWRVVGGGVQGIASRVQYGHVYRTFTVRESRPSGADTELAKRVRAILNPKEHYLFPAFTVQAYVERRRTGQLLYVCMVRTEELFRFILDSSDSLTRRRNAADGSVFIVVECDRLRAAGADVFEAAPKSEEPIIITIYRCFGCGMEYEAPIDECLVCDEECYPDQGEFWPD